ncbi:MFS transporter [Amycolatopsis sp. PS_44_ISF1]|uniref:MFS transporter n=1 Tax=Amycolatopsis sp. PS_44_ISF1 TaxID=2974917 RepID=UPI0028DF2889|nr:MFS transporter [Amycolatopsis sp. PS_44_ISF1]MDT8910196.1 MFS transporter [Amycolatopsis sp. PS_44_ISF1]MDT8916393.1 MFS transporter [Amycolatopsis sp. PS_44_ISF1]
MAEPGVAANGGVLRVSDFRRLWLADGLSQVGSRIDFLAIPLLAATTLSASVLEVSLLRTFSTLPYLVLGLQIGAWCDRMRHRPVLIAADLGRAALFGSIPVAAVCGVLTLGQVYAVVLLAGVLTVFFSVAHQTYGPHLVEPGRLPEANGLLQTNTSVAAVAGPGIGGAVVQFAGSAGAMAVDALSYLWSALWLSRVRTPDARPEPAERHLLREIAEDLKAVAGNRILLAITVHGAVTSLFQSMQMAISVVFLNREIGLSPGVIGLLSSAMLTGAILAGFTARRFGDRFGSARVLCASALLYGGSLPLSGLTSPGWGLLWYFAGGFGAGFGITMNVFCVSFQQAVIPRRLLGRVGAVSQTVLFGAAPLGSLLGGLVAEVAGMRATLLAAGAGALAASAILLASPLRKHRGLPVQP